MSNKTFVAAIAVAAFAALPAFATASKSDIQSFEQAKLTAGEAVSAAEKASGGKAMDVKFTTDSKKPAFDVIILKTGANATEHYIVDADTSTGSARQKQGVSAKVSGEPQSERASANVAKVSLSDAISKAESSAGGKVINAELELRGSTADYDMEVIKNGASAMYTVDAANGTVAPKK
jgi:uncharacterized membrane protein YkoI